MKKEKPEYVYCVVETGTNKRISYWYSRKQDAAAWIKRRKDWYDYVGGSCLVARVLVQLEVMDD